MHLSVGKGRGRLICDPLYRELVTLFCIFYKVLYVLVWYVITACHWCLLILYTCCVQDKSDHLTVLRPTAISSLYIPVTVHRLFDLMICMLLCPNSRHGWYMYWPSQQYYPTQVSHYGSWFPLWPKELLLQTALCLMMEDLSQNRKKLLLIFTYTLGDIHKFLNKK